MRIDTGRDRDERPFEDDTARMSLRRLASIAGICTALALSSVAAATPSLALTAPGTTSLSAAPFTVGTGTYPTTVATAAGGIVTYNYATPGFTFGPNRIGVCTLTAGLRKCAHTTALVYPFGSGALQDNPAAVFVSGSTVKVAAAGDSITGDPGSSDRVVVWTSTDGGVTFGSPVNLGLTSTNYGGLTFSRDASTVYTWTSGCGCGTAINALPTDGSAASLTTYKTIITAADQLGTIRGEIQVLPDGGLLLTASNFTPTVDVFWLHAGHNPLDPAQWSKVATVGNAEFLALAGTGLVSGPGTTASRVFLLVTNHTSGALVVQRWTGSGFVAAGSIPRGRGDASGAADGLGRLHAFYEPVSGFDQVVTSVGNGSYPKPTTAVGPKGALAAAQSSVSLVGAGAGWFAFTDIGASNTLKIVPLLQAHRITGPALVRIAKKHISVISGRVLTGRVGMTVTLNLVVHGTVGKAVGHVKLKAGLAYVFTLPAKTKGTFAVVAPAVAYFATTATKAVKV